MTDIRKFKILVVSTIALISLVLISSLLQEYLLPDVEGYVQRRSYYERVISKKGLSLQKGLYWKEKER